VFVGVFHLKFEISGLPLVFTPPALLAEDSFEVEWVGQQFAVRLLLPRRYRPFGGAHANGKRLPVELVFVAGTFLPTPGIRFPIRASAQIVARVGQLVIFNPRGMAVARASKSGRNPCAMRVCAVQKGDSAWGYPAIFDETMPDVGANAYSCRQLFPKAAVAASRVAS
jgi:hypothetical protein